MKINCIAIDDEPLALEKIQGFVDKINYLELKAIFTDPTEALSYLKEQEVDLIFLDVQMDQLTGIELLEGLQPEARVILTTAHSQYALKGYDLQVQDYLLKPFSFERFLKAANAAYDHIKMLKEKAVHPEYLFVKSGMVLKRVRFDEILYVEGMKDYLSIWTDNERVMTLMSFSKLMEVLPEGHFIRIHRSYVVSINKIIEVSKNRIKVADQLLPIGDTYKEEILSRFESGD